MLESILGKRVYSLGEILINGRLLVILYVQSVLFVLVYTLIQILTTTFVESKLDIIMIKLFHTIIFPKWSLFGHKYL